MTSTEYNGEEIAGLIDFDDPESIVLAEEHAEELLDIAEGLPSDLKAVFNLAVIEGRPLAEVADSLKLTLDTCKRRSSEAARFVRDVAETRGVKLWP